MLKSAFLLTLKHSRYKRQKSNNQPTVVSFTHDGEALNALRQPQWSTLEELVEPTTLTLALLLTTSACHTTQNIMALVNQQLIQHLSMGQSTKHGPVHWLILPTIMFPVLCAMPNGMQ